eukprot:1094218-Rhodomonas_salina.1
MKLNPKLSQIEIWKETPLKPVKGNNGVSVVQMPASANVVGTGTGEDTTQGSSATNCKATGIECETQYK